MSKQTRSNEIHDDTEAIFTRLQMGSQRQEYNVSELEVSIDKLRHIRDWAAVGALIKRYAHVFDIGCASEGGTNFKGERSRAYYWVVMAEVMIHQNKDLQNAGFCITRSAERDPNFGLWRITLVKILLIRTRKLTQENTSILSPSSSADFESGSVQPNDKTKRTKSDTGGGIQTVEYDKALKEMDDVERELIRSVIDSFKVSHQKAILSAFSALPSDEILRIFMEVLVRFNQLKLNPQDCDARVQLVYIICKKVLQSIHITDYYQQYLDNQLSEHNFWLVLDAISTRSLIREICGDFQQARSDIQQLVHVVVKQHSNSLGALPESIRESLLFTCCRLPILEKCMNLSSESLKSFRFCVSGDSIVAPHISDNVKIVLSMTAADMMIQLAYSIHQKTTHPASRTNSLVHNRNKGETARKENSVSADSIPDIVNHAYMLLANAKDLLEVNTSKNKCESDSKLVNSNIDFITHHPSSLIYDLKARLGSDYVHACKSDPVGLFEVSPTGATATEHVSILLSAVSEFLKGKRLNLESSVDILSWAMLVSVKPSYDLLWNISQSYLSPKVNKVNEAVSLMQQCIERKEATTNADEVRKICERDELISWLGLGVQIHKYPALPYLKCAEVCLRALGNPKKSIDIALQGLRQCAGAGGMECANLISRNLKAEPGLDFDVENSSGNPKKCLLTLSLMSSLCSTAVNIFQLVLTIATSFSSLSKCTHAGIQQTQQWLHKSRFMFDMLESTEMRDLFDTLPVTDEDDWSFEDKFYEKCRHQALASYVLHYSTQLAETGEISCALSRLKTFLDEIDEDKVTCDISNHLHLLVILLNTKQQAAPDNHNLVVNLCRKVIGMKSTKSSTSLTLANAQLSLAYLHFEKSEFIPSMELLDRICEMLKAINCLTEVEPFDYPFQQGILRVSILLQCSALYRKCGNLSKAQHGIEEAWLLLYSPNLSSLVHSVPKENHGADVFSTESQPYIDEAKRIHDFRGIPTLRGWRLPSKMGWGFADTIDRGWVGTSPEDLEEFSLTRLNYVSIEADLLVECAEVLFCKMKKENEGCDYGAVLEVIEMALIVDPNHFQSKLLMAKVSLESIEMMEPRSRRVEDILRANSYAQVAVRMNSKSSEAW